MQVAPFLQGVEPHSSMSSSHFVPERKKTNKSVDRQHYNTSITLIEFIIRCHGHAMIRDQRHVTQMKTKIIYTETWQVNIKVKNLVSDERTNKMMT